VRSRTFVAGFKTRLQVVRIWLPRVAYVFSVALFLWLISFFYLPGKGFSALLLLGDKMAERAIPEFIAVSPFQETESYGYDGQFYVQIAVSPDLRNPDLATAIDNLPYRARRILLSWTAWVIGGGDAERIIQVFSLQNVACWLALAVVLLRWFPATSLDNYLRWAGVMFSYGLCFSVRASLLDGPSLLAIAIAVMLLEKGRPWWSTTVLAASGLIRETNIMTASLLAEPGRKSWSEYATIAARGALIATPCALWVVYLNHAFGAHEAEGSGNFAIPFTAYWRKIVATAEDIATSGWNKANFSSVTMMVALTVQAAFLAFRPCWSQPWWRIGAPYVILMIALGDAMWEGYPGAAARALLPMALAFNVLLPRGRRWWWVLLLGNATIFSAPSLIRMPADQSYQLTVSPVLSISEDERKHWTVSFDENWYTPERSLGEYWCWSRGSAAIRVNNPHAVAVLVDIAGGLKSVESRMLTISRGDEKLWSGMVDDSRRDFAFEGLRFEPGVTWIRFETDQPSRPPRALDPRLLAFSLRDLNFKVIKPATGAGITTRERAP
jgi:hypothetical protein